MVPGTLRLQRRIIILIFRLVADSRRRLDEHLAQLLLLPGVPQVVAPKPRLRAKCLVSDVHGPLVAHAAFFAVNERREPEVFPDVGAPTVEIEVVAGQRRPAIRAVETHDVKILILHPDASDEASFILPAYRIDVKNQAAHLAQKLAPHILQPVIDRKSTRLNSSHITISYAVFCLKKKKNKKKYMNKNKKKNQKKKYKTINTKKLK